MKKIALILSFVFLVLTIHGQKVTPAQVPAAVKSTFKTKFPSATKVNWQMANANEYKANFVMKKVARTAYFAADGPWRQTETGLKSPEIPKNIKSSVPKLYPGYKIQSAYKVEKKEGAATYKILIVKGTKMLSLIYAINGELLKKGVEN